VEFLIIIITVKTVLSWCIIDMVTDRSWSEFCGKTNLMWKTQQLLWHLINVHNYLFFL